MYDVARRIAREPRREDGAVARTGASGPRVLVVLRMRVEGASADTAAVLDRVAKVARGLVAGELLAVRLSGEPRWAEAWLRLECEGVRVETCSFGPMDHEVLVWRPARPSRETCIAGRRTAGRPRTDGTPRDRRAHARRGRLGPGESRLHRSERGPPLLLVDLLAGRAVFEEGRAAEGHVLSRLVRRPVREDVGRPRARPAGRGAHDRLPPAYPRGRANRAPPLQAARPRLVGGTSRSAFQEWQRP